MIQPTYRTLLLLMIGLILALLPSFGLRGFEQAWLLWLLFCGAALVIELLLQPGRRNFALSYIAPTKAIVGANQDFVLQISSSRRTVHGKRLDYLLEVRDGLQAPPTRSLVLAGGSEEVTLSVRPERRGMTAVDAVWLRWTGPLRLLSRTARMPIEHAMDVHPDLAGVRKDAILWFRNRELSVGQRTKDFRGEGSEFDALREFQVGHDSRYLDWKSSARLRKLVVREYRAERDHQIVIGLDCGQLMREPLDEIPRLDHSIHAGLLLAFASLKTGDRVGLFAFDSKARRWIPPTSGNSAISRLEKECASLEYCKEPTNYVASLTTLFSNLHRRTLIVIFSEFWDPVSAELMVEILGRFSKRHLLVFVTFTDEFLQQIADRSIEERGDLHRIIVAEELMAERLEVHQRLRNLGVQVISTRAADLRSAVLKEYLRIHYKELL